MRVLYCDFGTYCDFSISNQLILRLLEQRHRVCYITSSGNPFLRHRAGLEVETHAPLPVVALARFAENRNILTDLVDPRTTLTTVRLLREQVSTFDAIAAMIRERSDNVDAVVLTYPLLCVARKIRPFVPGRVPIVLLYVAPAFPNTRIPWVFDDSMRTDEPLYRRGNRERNLASHSRNSWGASLCVDWRNLLRYYKETELTEPGVFIISAWNRDLIPAGVAPISVPRSRWFRIGAVVDRQSAPLPRVVRDFLRGGSVVYMTMGSMKVTGMRVLARVVCQAARRLGMRLLVQDQTKQVRSSKKQDFMVYHGPLPYASVLSGARLLVTTGSYCIQHLALLHGVPMLFVPVLTEQYFWAKNYQHHTGTKYLDNVSNLVDTNNEVERVERLLSLSLENKDCPWLRQQQRDLRKHDGALQFVPVLDKIIASKTR